MNGQRFGATCWRSCASSSTMGSYTSNLPLVIDGPTIVAPPHARRCLWRCTPHVCRTTPPLPWDEVQPTKGHLEAGPEPSTAHPGAIPSSQTIAASSGRWGAVSTMPGLSGHGLPEQIDKEPERRLFLEA